MDLLQFNRWKKIFKNFIILLWNIYFADRNLCHFFLIILLYIKIRGNGGMHILFSQEFTCLLHTSIVLYNLFFSRENSCLSGWNLSLIVVQLFTGKVTVLWKYGTSSLHHNIWKLRQPNSCHSRLNSM